jgi:hypothetical protein
LKFAKNPTEKNQKNLIDGKDYHYSEGPIDIPAHFFFDLKKISERSREFCGRTSRNGKYKKDDKKLPVGFNVPTLLKLFQFLPPMNF